MTIDTPLTRAAADLRRAVEDRMTPRQKALNDILKRSYELGDKLREHAAQIEYLRTSVTRLQALVENAIEAEDRGHV